MGVGAQSGGGDVSLVIFTNLRGASGREGARETDICSSRPKKSRDAGKSLIKGS